MVFLNGKQEEEIHMSQPIRFEVKNKGAPFASSDVLYVVLNNHLANDTLSSIKLCLVCFMMLEEDHCVYV